MSNLGCLMWGINLFLTLSRKYRIISADPVRKASTKYFGGYAIGTSIITCVLFALCSWGIFACLGAMGSGVGDLLLWVFIFILGLLDLTCIAELIVGGVMGIIYQLRCNKNIIWLIALIVLVVCVGALIAAMIYIISYSGIEL